MTFVIRKTLLFYLGETKITNLQIRIVLKEDMGKRLIWAKNIRIPSPSGELDQMLIKCTCYSWSYVREIRLQWLNQIGI